MIAVVEPTLPQSRGLNDRSIKKMAFLSRGFSSGVERVLRMHEAVGCGEKTQTLWLEEGGIHPLLRVVGDGVGSKWTNIIHFWDFILHNQKTVVTGV